MPATNSVFYDMVTTYLRKADRGSLVRLSEPVIQLFLCIEDHAYQYAKNLFQESSRGESKPCKQNAVLVACTEKEIAAKGFAACMLEEEKSQALLEGIVTLWIDLRIHSYTS